MIFLQLWQQMPASKMFDETSGPGSEDPPQLHLQFSIETGQVSDRDSSQQATLAAPADAYLDSVDKFWQLWQQLPASKMFAKPLALDLRTHPNFIPLFYGDRSSSDRDSSQQDTLVAPPDAYLNSVDDFLQLWQQMPASRMFAKPLALEHHQMHIWIQATLAAPAYAYLDSVDNFLQLWQQMPASKMCDKPLALDLRTHPNFISLFDRDRSSSD